MTQEINTSPERLREMATPENLRKYYDVVMRLLHALAAEKEALQAQEPVGVLYQHDETGRTTFVAPGGDSHFEEHNPRWGRVGSLYPAPQPLPQQPPHPKRPSRWFVGDRVLTPAGEGAISRISNIGSMQECFFADVQMPVGRFAFRGDELQPLPQQAEPRAPNQVRMNMPCIDFMQDKVGQALPEPVDVPLPGQVKPKVAGSITGIGTDRPAFSTLPLPVYYQPSPVDVPLPEPATIGTMTCEDCSGAGRIGEEYYCGEFQPPEQERCESCSGSGSWVVEHLYTADQLRTHAQAYAAAVLAAQRGTA